MQGVDTTKEKNTKQLFDFICDNGSCSHDLKDQKCEDSETYIPHVPCLSFMTNSVFLPFLGLK